MLPKDAVTGENFVSSWYFFLNLLLISKVAGVGFQRPVAKYLTNLSKMINQRMYQGS